MLDVGKLIRVSNQTHRYIRFSSMLDVGKLIPYLLKDDQLLKF